MKAVILVGGASLLILAGSPAAAAFQHTVVQGNGAAAAPAVIAHPVLLLQRYDLPGGGNLPQLIFDEVRRTLEVPADAPVPIALRFFGSGAYLIDESRNRVDWMNVDDIDAVLYIDEKAHREALKRSFPERSDKWVERRHDRQMREVKGRIQNRLSEVAARLQDGAFGGIGQVRDIAVHASFNALSVPGGRMPQGGIDFSPAWGYHGHDPHFANEAGAAKLRSAVGALSAEEKLLPVLRRDAFVQSDIKRRMSEGAVDRKLVKRFIQLAVLRGDDEQRRLFKQLLDRMSAGPFERLLNFMNVGPFGRRRFGVIALMQSALKKWDVPREILIERLQKTLAEAERGGPALVAP